MADDPRRFDDIARVVRDTRRELDDAKATLSYRVASHTHPSSGGGTVADATTTSKGVVQLSGDLAGTATAPTVPGLAGKANTSHTHAEADVTNLASDLAGKSPTSHLHDSRYYQVNQPVNIATANFFDLQESNKAVADAFHRHEIYADGYTKWGPGNVDLDTVMYRSNPGELTTTGRFVAQNITLGGADLVGTLNGKVTSVAPGDATVTVGGTATAPTLKVNAIAESQVTNLTTDLAGKSNVGHTHDVSALTNTSLLEAEYWLGADSSIPAGSDYQLTISSSSYTTSALTQSGAVWTIQKAGVWAINATVRWDFAASGARYATIGNNLGPFAAGARRYAQQGSTVSTDSQSSSMAFTRRFAVGDTLSVWLYQGTGGPLSVLAGITAGSTNVHGTNFAAVWLRP